MGHDHRSTINRKASYQTFESLSLHTISRHPSKESQSLTFAVFVLACNFSMKRGKANGPKRGVAERQALRVTVSVTPRSICTHSIYLRDTCNSSLVIPYGSFGGGENVIGK